MRTSILGGMRMRLATAMASLSVPAAEAESPKQEQIPRMRTARLVFPAKPRHESANMRLPKQEQMDIQDAAELKRLRKQARYAKQYKGD